MVDGDVRRWLAAAGDPGVEFALSVIHRRVAEEVASRRPLCLASGSCCRFDAFDHRLYATGLEAARCIRICTEEGRSIGLDDVARAREAGGCPWQDGRLCVARSGRPVGCRVFYCDPRAADWVPELAEWSHGAIRQLHEEHAIPYAYGEWRAMLEQVLESSSPRGC